MPLGRRCAWGVAVLVLTAGCTSCGGGASTAAPPPPPPGPAFDRALAWADLVQQCSYGPRNPGSAGHESCRAWLVAQLTPLADTLVKQDFSAATPMGGPYNFENLVALFGSAGGTGSPLLLAAHWDTRPVADQDPDPANRNTPILGANDGASGVAVLLELARLMKLSKPSRPVLLALLDAEDSGREGVTEWPYMGFCIGTNYLVTHWPADLPRPSEMVLLDMVGTDRVRNPRLQAPGVIDPPQFRLEGYSMASDPTLVNQIWTVAANLHHDDVFLRVPGEEIVDDHKPFIDNGIPGVDIIHFAPAEWHTIDDTPANCSADTLYEVGDTLVHVLWG